MESQKRINTLVLDSGPIIRNDPSVSSLFAQAETLTTTPAVLSEIRDEVTRQRVETLLKPFLTVRQPSTGSVKFVTDFARRTGDLAVLSKTDIQIIALTYELECERNGGDWRLRKAPGQKELNGPVPGKKVEGAGGATDEAKVANDGVSEEAPAMEPVTRDLSHESMTKTGNEASPPEQRDSTEQAGVSQISDEVKGAAEPDDAAAIETTSSDPKKATENTESVPQAEPTSGDTETAPSETTKDAEAEQGHQKDLTDFLAAASIEDETQERQPSTSPKVDSAQNSAPDEEPSASDSDSEGWITPSNLKKKQAEETNGSATGKDDKTHMQVAVITTDFAMQNVILQINLNLLSSSLQRVKFVRSTALRCQACFLVSKEMDKQFCPRCGKPTLTRVSCSTTANGEFKVHLKKNFQYNSRGDRYSIPKPVHGSANGRIKGGGKGGWGHELILTEDQKEYERAAKTEKRTKERNLMDEDYLPGILTGERKGTGGRIKVGAGRNVNTKKR